MRENAILFGVVLLALLSALSYAQAPVPFVNQPLVPDAVAPGGPEFTLTVNGTGFGPRSVVKWNDTALATQFISGSQLKATVPATNIATASTASVTVVNPAPGGGMSNTVFFPVTANAGDSLAFRQASSPATGLGPFFVAVDDFNRDGKLDLAVSTGSVLLGDGTGNFTLASSFPGGYSLVVGDFNGDGIPDLAVNSGLVLLGDGTGNFTLASSFPGGGAPFGGNAVAEGDFNGDGRLDLVVANYGSATVSILLGDGTGNFTLASSPAVGIEPIGVAVGDFNEDGKLDLAVGNYSDGTLSILLGDGSGNFTLASSVVVDHGGGPQWVAVGDFNGDGKLDLAVADTYNTVSILLGDGTGHFTLASSPFSGHTTYSVAVGDLNGDGKLDLAVANWDSSTVSILLGDGTGHFTLALSPATGHISSSVAEGDFNGDGKLDLAVTNYCGSGDCLRPPGTVSILLQVTPGPAATLSPTSLSFGSQLIHTPSQPQTVILTNTGNAMLDISGIAASANFSQKNNCGSSLLVGASCTITLIFRPLTACAKTGTLTITDNAANSPQTVALSGVGTVITLSPTSLNFSNQVGTTSAPQTVTLTNYSPDRVVPIYSIGITGTNGASFAQTNTCGSSVANLTSCAINVTFTPKSKGTKTATLNIADGGGDTPQKVTLIGNPQNGTIKVATGLDCSNHLITTGGTNDCHWTVNGNPAQVVKPGNADWWPGWVPDGPNSDWIAINANTCCDGPAPYSFNLVFDLSGANLSAVSLSGLWSIDDAGTLSLNGQQIDAQGGLWESLQPFSVPAGSPYFRQGSNTLTITMTSTDDYLEGVRLEGTVAGVAAK